MAAGADATVSCVVATNRASPYLREALESAASQSKPPVEIIVVLDGAPDVTAIRELVAGVPIARAIERRHSGVAASRNVGAKEATGEWIAFLDDDDRWHPERLARQLEALAQDPAAVVGYCGIRTIGAAGETLAHGDHTPVSGRLDVMRRRTGILAGNTLIRASSFADVGGFDEDILVAEDLDLMLRLAPRGSFVLCPEDLLDYRLHAGNTTGSHRRLSRGVRDVLARHRAAAIAEGDVDAQSALSASMRSNGRYAWWAATRAARAHGPRHPWRALSEWAWAARFAPLAPADAALRRLTRRDDGEA
ncbi:glycosyltransferase family A protein [Demequina sp. NBRC 110053]|uniref:glycosyltransferase family 2 protein n=1 Tax=Demequina sp. NBRC 110053 TaxID=1570342 RepID=UPI00135669C3|nr:glycosyltransferase family A protein [Demequina sp. NBRC 110053]